MTSGWIGTRDYIYQSSSTSASKLASPDAQAEAERPANATPYIDVWAFELAFLLFADRIVARCVVHIFTGAKSVEPRMPV